MLGLGFALTNFGTKGGVVDTPDLSGSSAAALLAAYGGEGFALDAATMTVAVVDTGTPANNFDGGANSKLTYASPSTKYIIDDSGYFVGGTTLRTAYDASANVLGLLVEPQATNIARNAQSINSWSKTGATTSTDALAAPDNATTAEKIIEDTSSGSHQAFTTASTTNGQTYRMAIYLKQAERGWAAIQIVGTSNPYIFVNLATGAFGSGSGSPNQRARLAPNGYWRVSIQAVANSTTTTVRVFIATGTSTNSYVGDGSSGIYVWQWDMVLGTLETSYIPATSSDVTRNADVVTLSTSSYPHSSSGACTITGTTAVGTNGANQVLWQCDDGTENNRLRIVRDSSTNLRFIVTAGGVEQCNIDLGTVANSTEFVVSVGWAENDFSASLNAGVPVTDTLGSVPAVTTARIGSSVTGEQWCGHILNLVEVPV